MKREKKRRMAVMIDMGSQSNRDICLGAVEYAADKADLDFAVEPIQQLNATALKNALKRQADGLLLHSCTFAEIASYRRLRTPRVYVLGNNPAIPAPVIGIDHIAIGRMAAEHLLERGYRQLAFVGFPALWSQLRWRGFNLTAKAHGLFVHRHELPMVLAYWWCREAENRNTLHKVLTALPNPCGIFAANDTIALFLIETARFHGIAVPEHVGIIGADDDPIANVASKLGISSIQLPCREVGRRAAETLHRLMRGQKCPHRQLLAPTRVVVRASTDTFMTEDPLLQRAQRYIEDNRQRHVQVADVSRALATTQRTLSRRFAHHLGTTPADYILRRRIEHAKELLRSGKLNVGEVSETCQFHSCSYFDQVFKSATGVSPRSFLKHNPTLAR